MIIKNTLNIYGIHYVLWIILCGGFVRNYNHANYAGNKQNVFLDSGVINLVVAHKSKAKLEFLDTAPNAVKGPDDSYSKAHQRLHKR